MSSTAQGPNSTRPLWLVVDVLLLVSIVVPLLAFVYDQQEPTLLGFPFFYWFQFLMIPVVGVLTYISFLIAESATRRDRQRHRNRGQAGERG